MLQKILSRLLTIYDSLQQCSPHVPTHEHDGDAANDDGSYESTELEPSSSTPTLTTSNIAQWPPMTSGLFVRNLTTENAVTVQYMTVVAMARYEAGKIETWN